MNIIAKSLLSGGLVWALAALSLAQEPPRPPEATPQPIEAKKQVIVLWTLGSQSWSFTDVETTYEAERGTLYPRTDEALAHAVWKLRIVREMQPGEAIRHNEMPGSPFKVVLLDAQRTVINPDVPARITPITGKVGDTFDLVVQLPDEPLLSDVKYVRVTRRTEVGF
jgi:hypothetical protein